MAVTPAPVVPVAPSPAPIPVVVPEPLKLDWSSGLTQIESDHSKVQAAQAAMAAAPAVPRVRRTRPVLPPVVDEPLVQVETQRAQPPA
jgi:hypothetical protein